VTQTAQAFINLMKATYTKGFDEDDAKVWIVPVARVAKKGVDKVTKLKPDAVKAKPIDAMNFTADRIAKGGMETAIAMQYCIEKDPTDGISY